MRRRYLDAGRLATPSVQHSNQANLRTHQPGVALSDGGAVAMSSSAFDGERRAAYAAAAQNARAHEDELRITRRRASRAERTIAESRELSLHGASRPAGTATNVLAEASRLSTFIDEASSRSDARALGLVATGTLSPAAAAPQASQQGAAPRAETPAPPLLMVASQRPAQLTQTAAAPSSTLRTLTSSQRFALAVENARTRSGSGVTAGPSAPVMTPAQRRRIAIEQEAIENVHAVTGGASSTTGPRRTMSVDNAAYANEMAEAVTQEFMAALESTPESREDIEARIAARRRRVDEALRRARSAAEELQGLRDRVELAGSASLNEARERAAMMMLVHSLAVSHQELLSRYQELQLEVAVARSLDAMGSSKPPQGVPRERLEKEVPSVSYSSVLRGSRSYDLPGDGECAVCQNVLEPADEVRLLPCRHAFHTSCIDPWFARSTCCPTCRHSL